MQIWISCPRETTLAGLKPALFKRWAQSAQFATKNGVETGVHLLEPLPNEIHGEFLTRLWSTEILESPDDEHLISELDFLPYRDTVLRIATTARAGGFDLLGVPYVRRVYSPDQSTRLHSGKVETYEQDGLPLLGPWLLYLNLAKHRTLHLPQMDWLGAAGPFNDAGNLALHSLRASGFLTETNFALLPAKDAFPLIHGTQYPRVGIHTFFAREYDAPADKEILGFGCKEPLLAGTHLNNVRRLVKG